MSNVIATVLSAILVAPGTQAIPASPPTLESIQGVWWSACRNPTAEFAISGDEYSGDFLGAYALELSGDVLTFKSGLADGHSINVTYAPLAFRILSVGSGRLVLRPMAGGDDWTLLACTSMPRDNSFKPPALIQVSGAYANIGRCLQVAIQYVGLGRDCACRTEADALRARVDSGSRDARAIHRQEHELVAGFGKFVAHRLPSARSSRNAPSHPNTQVPGART